MIVVSAAVIGRWDRGFGDGPWTWQFRCFLWTCNMHPVELVVFTCVAQQYTLTETPIRQHINPFPNSQSCRTRDTARVNYRVNFPQFQCSHHISTRISTIVVSCWQSIWRTLCSFWFQQWWSSHYTQDQIENSLFLRLYPSTSSARDLLLLRRNLEN